MATSFPGAIDSLPRPNSTTDQMNTAGLEGDVVIDNISDAIEAIETELGTDPAGTFATVKARLNSADKVSIFSFAPAGWWRIAGTFTDNRGYTDTSIAATRLIATPMVIEQSCTITKYACRVVTTAAGSTLRVGIYDSDANGLPGNLVANSETTIDTATATGIIETILSTAPSLTPGRYWVAAVYQGGAPTVRSAAFGWTGPENSNANLLPSGAPNVIPAYKMGTASGALPSTGVAGLTDHQVAFPLIALLLGT